MEPRNRSIVRGLMIVGAIVVVCDLTAWGFHVVWRAGAVARLDPVVTEIDELTRQIAMDDAWIESSSRLMQEYGQPDRYAARMQSRGRRAAAHRAMVDAYNQRVEAAYQRFYWIPLPAPEPPFRPHLSK